MHQLSSRFSILICALLVSISDLAADSYRCGQKLITTGDSSTQLIRVCGEPRHKDRGTEKIKVNGVSKDTRVERWYYRKNSRSLERTVLIYKGRVAGIKVGRR